MWSANSYSLKPNCPHLFARIWKTVEILLHFFARLSSQQQQRRRGLIFFYFLFIFVQTGGGGEHQGLYNIPCRWLIIRQEEESIKDYITSHVDGSSSENIISVGLSCRTILYLERFYKHKIHSNTVEKALTDTEPC